MNYRNALLLAPEDLGPSGTKVIDLDLSQPVSRLTIRFRTTKVLYNMTAAGPANISKIELVDGSSHDVDLSEMAFKIAGSMAFKEAASRARPVLLEPIMDIEVVTPTEYMGEVLGDLNSRRGKIGGMTQRGEAQVIGASAPLAEMFGYSTVLRSLTQGRAVYTMQFSHYAEVPKSKADEIVSKLKG